MLQYQQELRLNFLDGWAFLFPTQLNSPLGFFLLIIYLTKVSEISQIIQNTIDNEINLFNPAFYFMFIYIPLSLKTFRESLQKLAFDPRQLTTC